MAEWTGPLSIGLNCALGPDLLRQYVEELSRVCETFVSVHPNAGLPNEFGEYDLEADDMAKEIIDWGKSGFINHLDAGILAGFETFIFFLRASLTGVLE